MFLLLVNLCISALFQLDIYLFFLEFHFLVAHWSGMFDSWLVIQKSGAAGAFEVAFMSCYAGLTCPTWMTLQVSTPCIPSSGESFPPCEAAARRGSQHPFQALQWRQGQQQTITISRASIGLAALTALALGKDIVFASHDEVWPSGASWMWQNCCFCTAVRSTTRCIQTVRTDLEQTQDLSKLEWKKLTPEFKQASSFAAWALDAFHARMRTATVDATWC